MTIQFICRGNVFRSIIAEAYTNSLGLPGVIILSSGTCAGKNKVNNAENFPRTLALLQEHGIEQYAKDHYADDLNQDLLNETDISICLNKIAYEEAVASFKLPAQNLVWDVTDIGEIGRIPATEAERNAYSEEVYAEIVKNVDEFVKRIPEVSRVD